MKNLAKLSTAQTRMAMSKINLAIQTLILHNYMVDYSSLDILNMIRNNQNIPYLSMIDVFDVVSLTLRLHTNVDYPLHEELGSPEFVYSGVN